MRLRRREEGASPRAADPLSAPAAAGAGPREGAADAPTEARPVRRRFGRGARGAGVAVGALGAGVLAIARLVRLLTTLVVLLIVLAVVLRDVDANSANSIVKAIHDGANFFAGAFTNLITFAGHPKRAITIDWGIAALAYLLLGFWLARVIARVGLGGRRFSETRRGPGPLPGGTV